MYPITEVTRQTLDVLAKSILDGSKDGTLSKAIDTATGLTGVNLQAPAKQLVPLMSPFRQNISRTVRDGATASQWKAITALSMPKATVAESAASAAFTTTVAAKSAAYKSIGLRGQVTREAIAASNGFAPALAKETANTLLLAMKMEEIQMLGGNVTALSTPGTPTGSSVAVSGVSSNFGTANYYVRIAALTLPAAMRVAIQRPADYTADGGLLAGTATAAVDPASDGVTVVGTEATVAMTATQCLKLSWTPIAGAAAYAVFVGTATGAANVKCEAIVSQAQVTLTSIAGTGQAGSALAGTSADSLAYDGIIAQVVAGGSGAYLKNLAGKLTQANGEIVEIQDAFANIWETAKIGAFRVLVSGTEERILTRLGVLSGGGPSIQVSPTDAAGRVSLTQGYSVGSIINATSGRVCPVDVLPWMPGGSILILPTEIPYNDANAEAPFDMALGFDWERIDYAKTTSTGPVFPFEVRCYGVLRAILTGGCGYIYNVYKG